ncbi:MAG: hypothetical protein U5K74_13230 [Gemmatimonadaceae bacterium]|nr:hypothetical protein [Gemmatimonadaceae bacterium]
MAREVTAQRLAQVLPPSMRRPEALRRDEEQLGVDLREDDREGPLPAFPDLLRRLARVEPRIRVHFARLPGATIELVEVGAVVGAGVEEVRIERIGRDVAGLTTARLIRHGHAAVRSMIAPSAPRRRARFAWPIESRRAFQLNGVQSVELSCCDPHT